MTDDHTHEDSLRRLLSDAVSDVEPRDALPQIQADIHATTRTRPQEAAMARRSSSTSSWTYAFTGALLAAAAIVAVFLLFTPGDDDPNTGPAAGETRNGNGQGGNGQGGGEDPTADASDEPTQDTEPIGDTEVTAVYYYAQTKAGPRLFREFQEATGADGYARALTLLQGQPLDPDYRTAWPEGSLTEAAFDGEVISVSIADASLRAIPQGVDEATARAAVEQVIYTLQGAAQDRAPVQFRLDGNPVDQVYGVPTSEPLANGPVLETLNLMSVTEPQTGSTHNGSMEISGVANSFEANVQWRIIAAGGKTVADGFVTAEGWMEEQLFPWSDTITISKLAPGEYTFVAQTDDPSGGAEGFGPAVDTKRFTVG